MVLRPLRTFVRRMGGATALLLILTGFARADEQALLKASAEMDRQYIPVLVHLRQGNNAAADESMMAFSLQWSQFATTFAVHSDDPRWQQDMERASGLVSGAFVDLQQDKSSSARKALLEFRSLMQQMRSRNDIDYFPDRLLTYHTEMSGMIAIAGEKSGRRFTLEQIRALQQHWARIWPCWQGIRRHVSRAAFDQSLFEFSDDRFVELKQAVADEQMALNRLRMALRTGSHQQIADAVFALDAGFMRSYRVFGELAYD